MNSLKTFFDLLKQSSISSAQSLMEEWGPDERFAPVLALPFSAENLVLLRKWISFFYFDRISGVCTEALWARFHKDHVAFIREFDEKALEYGILITEKRSCVSATEYARDAGMIQLKDGKVSLTVKGKALVEELEKQME